ncbi:DUF1801 domain-containing protein [Asanoa sp. WMMD1127]|uniref:DUF1801 domain-containing protein n=1 Tax=Asanoa sp. WMMD1127 TaxID=3016107 RepID=UPI002416828E|nr:DUF1801 domain-containing protein [Asanoa sp. WMMD1127]MDG4821964.1 DUF1801 domain-containing protein [Asanoa sp. WMMD1127]
MTDDERDELIAMVRRVQPDFDEAVKWGRRTFTVDGDWHHWVCAVTPQKIVFHKGALLADPDGLLTGSGAYVREVSAAAARAAPAAVESLVREAVKRQRDMV